jgi:uncharacterized protein YhbP (UPF0306 family)
MNKTIIEFIKKQTVASVCCLDAENCPYCFSVFFSFSPVNGLLHFKSSGSSSHAGFLLKNRVVAGTILPDKLNLLFIRGIQFTGVILDYSDPLTRSASTEYHKRFPFALAMPGEVWTLQLESIKMTDSTKGFGKKILWKREATSIPIDAGYLVT